MRRMWKSDRSIWLSCFWLAIWLGQSLLAEGQPSGSRVVRTADVIIAGGSTAALAAAFTAAEEGAATILIEPTDWIGGQLTASGVPAVDEAWHQIKDPQTGAVALDVAKIARDPRNMTPAFRDMLLDIKERNRGWVSRFCFEPKWMLTNHLEPWERRLQDRLTVLRDTVVKQVIVSDDGRRIDSIICIRRMPKPGVSHHGYDRLLSEDLLDWYDPAPSARFDKQTVEIRGSGEHAVFIEGTEWGEVLALSGGTYRQGLDEGDVPAGEENDVCGQSTVFDFVQRYHEGPVEDRSPVGSDQHQGWGAYEGREDVWDKVWTYRRIRGTGAKPSVGDLCLQNWGYSPSRGHGGNDYPFGYLLLSKEQTAASVDDWRGGVDLQTLAGAEQRAFGWHRWFRDQTPASIGKEHIALAFDILGTGHGLAKLPYVRDTRRSVGIGGFVLRLEDLIGREGDSVARQFADQVAIGCYPADVHPVASCEFPPNVTEHRDTRPFCIPLRALTHEQFENLLVVGKTMAQDFMANSATRLHPIEWSTGAAGGATAAWMVREKESLAGAIEQINAVHRVTTRHTPAKWEVGSRIEK